MPDGTQLALDAVQSCCRMTDAATPLYTPGNYCIGIPKLLEQECRQTEESCTEPHHEDSGDPANVVQIIL